MTRQSIWKDFGTDFQQLKDSAWWLMIKFFTFVLSSVFWFCRELMQNFSYGLLHYGGASFIFWILFFYVPHWNRKCYYFSSFFLFFSCCENAFLMWVLCRGMVKWLVHTFKQQPPCGFDLLAQKEPLPKPNRKLTISQFLCSSLPICMCFYFYNFNMIGFKFSQAKLNIFGMQSY